ncbi:alpha/beta fold hydrolase [Aestuariivirga sp.]|uniref:alpha/beta fold hydrolase n=1 Tax=Aestuariivirga sp. TaxID=2650926 RepID=UPI0035948387
MPYVEHHIATADGVRIYARDHAPDAEGLTPALCLPGLTRNAKDFETIVPHLSRTRRVISIDFRGRGRSDRADPATYRPDQEVADTLQVLDHLGIDKVAIVGTSRGGIAAMVMAARALPRIAGVVFNDIGPKIDKAGLLRIRIYLGSDPRFTGWDQAVQILKATNPGFPSLHNEQWMAFARRVYRDENGLPRADYDPGLTANFPTAADIEAGKVPELWALFDMMADVPSLVLRGEYSDLLSAATVAEMQKRHRKLAAVTVADRGHVPFLDEPESIAAIDQWLAEVDRRAKA